MERQTKGHERKKKIFFSLENGFVFYTEIENDVDGQHGKVVGSIWFVLFPDFIWSLTSEDLWDF